MSSHALAVQNVSKSYLVGHKVASRDRYSALSDVITRTARGYLRSAESLLRGRTLVQGDTVEEFWALKDVSFDISPGEVVGIIGRNGAGKSTLLKLLSRITKPSRGRIEIAGRVASLLEVGTGFHPELTGRENIFLNGAILGMRRSEIERRFDEIVDFSEVERFLDTPVKRYSSGMYTRLAFAIAAHLQTDIMIVDEVLAVGDVEFQRKCLGKIGETAKNEGRTTLFVSHNTAAVRALCSRALLLRHGHLAADGPVDAVVDAYLGESEMAATRVVQKNSSERPHFVELSCDKSAYAYGDIIEVSLILLSSNAATVAIEMELHDERGGPVAYASTSPMYGETIRLEANLERELKLSVGPMLLAMGDYTLHFWLTLPWAEIYDISREPLRFRIEQSDPGSSGFEFRQSYGRGVTTFTVKAH